MPEINAMGGTSLTAEVETEDQEFFRFEQDQVLVHVNGEKQLDREAPVTAVNRLSKRHFAARGLDWTGCGACLRRWPTWRGVLILNYHRIGYSWESDFDRNLWSATPEDFCAHLEILQRNFDVIGPGDLDRALNDRRGRAVMITFDDGYLDNYTHAFTMLKRHGLTATFFVSTGFLDQPQVPWWDEIAWMVRRTSLPFLPTSDWVPEQVLLDEAHQDLAIKRLLKIFKRLDGRQTAEYLTYLAVALQTGRCPADRARGLWMTWEMVREMRSGGMTIGGHSITHPILTRISPEQQDFEIGECRRRLVDELGEPIDTFSYPVGGGDSFSQTTIDAVARHGYRWGFTYLGGYLKPGKFERFALRRTAIESETDLPMFRALVTLPQFFA